MHRFIVFPLVCLAALALYKVTIVLFVRVQNAGTFLSGKKAARGSANMDQHELDSSGASLRLLFQTSDSWAASI